MAELVTDLGEENRRTGKHMRRVDGRKPRRDLGVPSPGRRRSPEHYARMQEAMRRSKRTTKIVRLLNDTGPLTAGQIETIRLALEGISVVGESTAQISGAA